MKEVPVTKTQIPAASALGVTKVFGFGETAVTALDDVSVSFEQGKFSAIMGPSGSGKSTLLHCLAGLDRVTDGQVFIGDVDLTGLNDKRLTQLRRDKIGFVFQAFNLVPTLNARENITLPMDIAGRKPDAEWLTHVIEILTLGDRLTQWRQPEPWPAARRSSSPTSPRETSTRNPGRNCSAS
jgi:putative ABC transport system ATP-binding protein